MISLQEVCKKVTTEYPDLRIVGCLDYGPFYGVETVSRDWDGDVSKKEAMMSNNSLTYIRKSNGEKFFLSFAEALELKPKRRLNINDCVSKEDVAFINRFRERGVLR